MRKYMDTQMAPEVFPKQIEARNEYLGVPTRRYEHISYLPIIMMVVRSCKICVMSLRFVAILHFYNFTMERIAER